MTGVSSPFVAFFFKKKKVFLGTTFVEQLHISRLKLSHSWKASLISHSKLLISEDLKPHAREPWPSSLSVASCFISTTPQEHEYLDPLYLVPLYAERENL